MAFPHDHLTRIVNVHWPDDEPPPGGGGFTTTVDTYFQNVVFRTALLNGDLVFQSWVDGPTTVQYTWTVTKIWRGRPPVTTISTTSTYNAMNSQIGSDAIAYISNPPATIRILDTGAWVSISHDDGSPDWYRAQVIKGSSGLISSTSDYP